MPKHIARALKEMMDEKPWTPKVGDKVQGSRLEWYGLTGVIIEEGPGWANVDWDTGQKCPITGNAMHQTYFCGTFAPERYLKPAGYPELPDQRDGLTAPEGVTLRYVTEEEYKELTTFNPARAGWSLAIGKSVQASGANREGAEHTLSITRLKPGETWLVCPPRDHPLYPDGKYGTQTGREKCRAVRIPVRRVYGNNHGVDVAIFRNGEYRGYLVLVWGEERYTVVKTHVYLKGKPASAFAGCDLSEPGYELRVHVSYDGPLPETDGSVEWYWVE